MNLHDLAETTWARLNELAIAPLTQFFRGLDPDDRTVLYVLLTAAVAVGFVIGRRRTIRIGRRRTIRIGGSRAPAIQNRGEALVSRVLVSHFGPPDYHLMNHVTMRMEDGTTEVDHILVSRFGIFVIETKDYSGWIFANAADATWTQVRYRRKFKFQNPIFQNRRHVRAVQGLLDFVPPETIKSVVVFSGDAEFKTERPQGVMAVDELVEYLRQEREGVMSSNRLQFCVGRLETTRLAITRATDVEHMESLAHRHGDETR